MDIYDPKCITDSGSSQILLPLIESVCDDLWETNPDTPKKMGSLLLDLEGVNGSTITLPLPLLWLAEQIAGTSGDFALGLPIFHYYYLVYDMENSTVTFVDLQLSKKTEAFIHGPELGGVSEPNTNSDSSTSSDSSTGSRRTGSPSTITFVTVGLLLLACKYIF
jgi:hypothetical protein